jgi:hypothetical protein
MRRLTAEHNSPMPVIDIAHQHLLTARALHDANKLGAAEQFEVLDWSAIIAASRVAAGLEGFSSGKVSLYRFLRLRATLIHVILQHSGVIPED